MAKEKNNGGQVAEANGETNGSTESAAPSRFSKIATERYMFNVEKCYAALPVSERLPLVGYLLNMIPMPAMKGGREWEACVIRTTEPCNVMNREKTIIRVE